MEFSFFAVVKWWNSRSGFVLGHKKAQITCNIARIARQNVRRRAFCEVCDGNHDAIPTAHHKQNVCDLQTTIQVRHSWSAAAADLEGDGLAGRCDAGGPWLGVPRPPSKPGPLTGACSHYGSAAQSHLGAHVRSGAGRRDPRDRRRPRGGRAPGRVEE